MRELDLIPADYRRAVVLQRRALSFAVVYTALVGCLLLAKLGIGYGVESRSEEVAQLERALAVEKMQQSELSELRASAEDGQRRLKILEGLRGGVAARQMFSVVDRATDGRVQIKDWRFARAGELVEEEPDSVEAGYFIILPRTKERDARKQGWLMRTQMEMRARAPDHSALARFVRGLLEQPEIDEVRVLSTRSPGRAQSEAVDFDLAVSVRTRT